jgi:hypothetical protein
MAFLLLPVDLVLGLLFQFFYLPSELFYLLDTWIPEYCSLLVLALQIPLVSRYEKVPSDEGCMTHIQDV